MTKGIDILVKIGNTIVAAQKGATLNRQAETIDTTTKNSGTWKEFESTFKTWSIECEGLYTLPTATNGFKMLEDAFALGEKVTVQFAIADDGAEIGDVLGFTGQAIITDFPIEAPMDDSATFSISLQGTGALQELKAE